MWKVFWFCALASLDVCLPERSMLQFVIEFYLEERLLCLGCLIKSDRFVAVASCFLNGDNNASVLPIDFWWKNIVVRAERGTPSAILGLRVHERFHKVSQILFANDIAIGQLNQSYGSMFQMGVPWGSKKDFGDYWQKLTFDSCSYSTLQSPFNELKLDVRDYCNMRGYGACCGKLEQTVSTTLKHVKGNLLVCIDGHVYGILQHVEGIKLYFTFFENFLHFLWLPIEIPGESFSTKAIMTGAGQTIFSNLVIVASALVAIK